jgi:cytidylate kinase
MDNKPFVITISRQLGSGGSYLGRWLANKLAIPYVDYEIIHHVAEKLQVPVSDVEHRDEKLTSFWNSVLLSSEYLGAASYEVPAIHLPTDREFFRVESGIIRSIAENQSAVIVGRGGSWVLRDQPRHLSVFLHADLEFRKQRVQALNKITVEEAEKLIYATEKNRGRYLKALSGLDWLDATQYHLSIDTAKIGLEAAGELILSCVRSRFGLDSQPPKNAAI